MRPPFDFVRASFWLVAVVIVAHVILAMLGATACVLLMGNALPEIISGRWKCDGDNRLFDLLGNALSAALAFAAGRLTTKPPEDKQP